MKSYENNFEVNGFDPKEFCLDISKNNDGSNLYLEAKWKIYWFKRYCQDNRINGLIDSGDYQLINPLAGDMRYAMWVVTCTIRMNGEVISRASAGCPYLYDGAFDPYAVQTAGTRAVSKALTNAGFDIPSGSTPDSDGAGERETIMKNNGLNELPQYVTPAPTAQSMGTPPVATVTEPAPVQSRNNPAPAAAAPGSMAPAPAPAQRMETPQSAAMTAAPQNTGYVPQQMVMQPQPTQVAQQNSWEIPMDLAQAKAVVMPKGKCAGMTIGDVFLSDAGMIRYIDEHPSRYSQEVVAAARVLLSNQR